MKLAEALKEIKRLREDLAQAEQDTERLRWMIIALGLDETGDHELAAKAKEFAKLFGRKEPNDDDWLASLRYVIDGGRKLIGWI